MIEDLSPLGVTSDEVDEEVGEEGEYGECEEGGH